jgi:taurine transport system substrate-binding protein
MIKRSNRLFGWAAGVPLVLFAGLLCWVPNARSADQIHVNLNLGDCICHAPFLVAEAKGFLDEELKPLSVTYSIVRTPTGPAVIAGLQAGAIDIGLLGGASATLIADNIPVKFIGIGDNPTEGEGLAVKAGINTVRGLIGKKVATPLGTSGDVMLHGVFEMYNLPASKIEIVNLAPPAMAAAWARNDVQGAYIWDPWFSKLSEMDGKKLITDGEVVKATNGKFNAGWNAYLVTDKFAAQHPEVVRAYLRAVNKGAKFINSNPAAAAEAAFKLYGTSSAKEMLDQINGDTFPTAEEWGTQTWLGSKDKPGQFGGALMSIWEVMHASGRLRTTPSLTAVQAALNPGYIPSN